MWGLTQSTTGGRMDRQFTGQMTIGGRGSNRNFHGKVASMMVTTLKCGVAMPDTTEIELMVKNPIKWLEDYKIGQDYRGSNDTTTVTSDWQLINTKPTGSTQLWLMGDVVGDAYPVLLSYTNTNASTSGQSVRMIMNSQVSNDIEDIEDPIN